MKINAPHYAAMTLPHCYHYYLRHILPHIYLRYASLRCHYSHCHSHDCHFRRADALSAEFIIAALVYATILFSYVCHMALLATLVYRRRDTCHMLCHFRHVSDVITAADYVINTSLRPHYMLRHMPLAD